MSYPDPRYRGDEGEVSATIRPVNEASPLTIGSDTAVHYLATGASTNGQFGLYRWDAKPRTPGPNDSLPPDHIGIVLHPVRDHQILQWRPVDRREAGSVSLCPGGRPARLSQ